VCIVTRFRCAIGHGWSGSEAGSHLGSEKVASERTGRTGRHDSAMKRAATVGKRDKRASDRVVCPLPHGRGSDRAVILSSLFHRRMRVRNKGCFPAASTGKLLPAVATQTRRRWPMTPGTRPERTISSGLFCRRRGLTPGSSAGAFRRGSPGSEAGPWPLV